LLHWKLIEDWHSIHSVLSPFGISAPNGVCHTEDTY
jgi:hypothetical protein